MICGETRVSVKGVSVANERAPRGSRIHGWSADLLEGRRPLDFGNLPLLPPLDPRCAGVQRVVRRRIVVLLTLGRGRRAARAQTTELRRHTNWEEERKDSLA